MKLLITLWSVLSVLGSLELLTQDSRAPVPPSSERRKAEKEIRKAYKAEYAKKSRYKRKELAEELLKMAMQSKESNAERFALFKEARDLAAEAILPSLAFRIVDEMAAVFSVEPYSLKQDALSAASKSARMPAHLREVAYFGLQFAEDAAAADEFDAATQAAELAKSMAKRAGDPALAGLATGRAKALAGLKRSYAKLKMAAASLAANPKDGDASLAIGRFYCFSKGDWERGLPLLAKGSDAALKRLARDDLAGPTESEKQAGLGDAWWDRAAKARGDEKRNLQLRSKHWYEKAGTEVPILIKARVLKRLKQLEAVAGRTRIENLLDLIDPKSDGIKGAWRKEGSALIAPKDSHAQLEIPYIPPAEYDLRAVVERMDGKAFLLIGLAVGDTQFDVVLDAPGGITSLHQLDRKNFSDNEVAHVGSALFTAGKPSTVLCSVRRNRLMVSVDGRSLIDWKANYRRLRLLGAWKLKNKNTVFLGSIQTRFRIHELKLTPFLQGGKRLR